MQCFTEVFHWTVFFLENHVELFKDFLNGFLLDVYQTDMA